MHEPVERTLVEPTLVEAAEVTMTADQALNAVQVEVIDQGGAGFALLLGPAQVTEFTVKLLAELSAFLPVQRHRRAVQMTDRSHPPLPGRRHNFSHGGRGGPGGRGHPSGAAKREARARSQSEGQRNV
jgi:hypothetical protein